MNVDMKAYVEELLKTYTDREQKINVLRYELEHPASSSENAQIYAMALAHNNGLGRSGSHISNKTMYIALNYQEKTQKMNSGITDEIAVELLKLEQEQDRLNYYISLLYPKQAEVLHLLYIKCMKQKDVEKVLGRSAKTIRNLKKEALATLVKMYECAVNSH
nr:hypothetical protein [uncultured Oscillibacter sp.]